MPKLWLLFFYRQVYCAFTFTAVFNCQTMMIILLIFFCWIFFVICKIKNHSSWHFYLFLWNLVVIPFSMSVINSKAVTYFWTLFPRNPCSFIWAVFEYNRKKAIVLNYIYWNLHVYAFVLKFSFCFLNCWFSDFLEMVWSNQFRINFSV